MYLSWEGLWGDSGRMCMRFTEILFWGSKSSLRRIAPWGFQRVSGPKSQVKAPALGCNGYITCLEQNRHLLSKLTET
jgi:hypothetical protein